MAQIIGHERALNVIQAALRSQRVHHAWIFHGPQGVGKFTVALATAKVLLCQEAQADLAGMIGPCGACDSCRLFESAEDLREIAHPDLHLIYKELAGDSEIRALREKKQFNIPIDLLRIHMFGGPVDGRHYESIVGKKAMMAHGKVFIVDEAELLDMAGQNALLKTLEEPPPGTVIFLITSNEDRLLPTIRSRCQRIPFTALMDAQVKSWLDGRPEAHELRDHHAAWIVKFARGSLGRAVLAAEYRLDEWAATMEPMIQNIAAGRAEVDLGPTMQQRVGAFAEAAVKKRKGASKDAANKAAVRHMLGLIGEICRQGLRRTVDEAGGKDTAAIEQAARPWLEGIELIQDAERSLEANLNIGLLLENLAIQWSSGAGAMRVAGAVRA